MRGTSPVLKPTISSPRSYDLRFRTYDIGPTRPYSVQTGRPELSFRPFGPPFPSDSSRPVQNLRYPPIVRQDGFLHDNGPNTTKNRSKSRKSVTCNYCKKPGHVKIKCRALKAKNDKFTHKGSRSEEVNFCGSSSRTLRSTVGVTPEDDPNILNVESMTDAEIVLRAEDATS
jgi:hypothetical protein